MFPQNVMSTDELKAKYKAQSRLLRPFAIILLLLSITMFYLQETLLCVGVCILCIWSVIHLYSLSKGIKNPYMHPSIYAQELNELKNTINGSRYEPELKAYLAKVINVRGRLRFTDDEYRQLVHDIALCKEELELKKDRVGTRSSLKELQIYVGELR